MKLRWSPEAKRDLVKIIEYIWTDNPAAAKRMRDTLRAAAERLQSTPFMGRPGVIPRTRELIPHPSYRLIYDVVDDTITVHAVIHTSRQWPPVIE